MPKFCKALSQKAQLAPPAVNYCKAVAPCHTAHKVVCILAGLDLDLVLVPITKGGFVGGQKPTARCTGASGGAEHPDLHRLHVEPTHLRCAGRRAERRVVVSRARVRAAKRHPAIQPQPIAVHLPSNQPVSFVCKQQGCWQCACDGGRSDLAFGLVGGAAQPERLAV